MKYSVQAVTEFMFADLLKRTHAQERRFTVLEDRPLRSLKRKWDEVVWADEGEEEPPRHRRDFRSVWGGGTALPWPLNAPPPPPCRLETVTFEGRSRTFWTHSNVRNRHPRLDRIEFHGGFDEPDVHYYVIDGRRGGYESCTGYLHHYLPDFEAMRDEKASMCLRATRPASPYFGMKTIPEVHDFWAKVRDNGTCYHAAMDDRLQGRPMRQPCYQIGKSDRITGPPLGFDHFMVDHPELEPYSTEFSVFHMDWMICGQFDALFWDTVRQCFVLVDWKNTLNFQTKGRGEKGTHPLTAHMDDCHLVKYTLQLNVYAAILEAVYDFKVAERWIVNFLALEPGKYQCHVAERMDMRPFFAECPMTEEGRQRLLEEGGEE